MPDADDFDVEELRRLLRGGKPAAAPEPAAPRASEAPRGAGGVAKPAARAKPKGANVAGANAKAVKRRKPR